MKGVSCMTGIEQSQEINELATALAKVQGAIGAVKKGAENPYFKSKYADMASIREHCRPVLEANGVAILQLSNTHIVCGDVYVGVTTQVTHISGQWMRSHLLLKPTKADPQGMGSAITYACRYAFVPLVGLALVDDDGNAASQPEKKPDRAKRVTAKLVKEFDGEIIPAKKLDDKAEIAKAYGNAMFKRLKEIKTKQGLDEWLNEVNAKHEAGDIDEPMYQTLKAKWHERHEALEL